MNEDALKHTVVIGHSLAGFKAAEILARDAAHAVTMILCDEPRLYSRYQLPALLDPATDRQQIISDIPQEVQSLNIDIIHDKIVDRISFKKKQIQLSDKNKIAWHHLMIAATGLAAVPKIKGHQKTGVFALNRLADAEALLQFLPMVESVTVISDTTFGRRVARAVERRKKEVLWVVSSQEKLEALCDAETRERLQDEGSPQGLRCVAGSEVTEILGDNDVKAVRLSSGKVMASQMVVFADAPMDLKLFKDTELNFGDRIPVDAVYQTNIKHVYAVDTVCRRPDEEDGLEDNYEAMMQAQGTTVAQKILWQEPQSDEAARENCSAAAGSGIPSQASGGDPAGG